MLSSWRTMRTLMLGLLVVAGCAKNKTQDPFAQAKYLATEQADMKNAPLAETPDILPQTYFAAGNLFVSQGQLGKAIEQYRKAIAVNHSFAAAYHRLGRTLSLVGQHEEAVKALAKAVELKPAVPLLRNDYGYELMYLALWQESEQQLRKAIEIDPAFARAHVNLGLVLSRTERFDEALAAFRTVLPETDARYNLGLLYRGQKRYVEAAEEFRRVLELDPQFPAARVQLDQLATHLESSAMRQREALAATVSPPAADLAEAMEIFEEPVAPDVEHLTIQRMASTPLNPPLARGEEHALVRGEEEYTRSLSPPAAIHVSNEMSPWEPAPGPMSAEDTGTQAEPLFSALPAEAAMIEVSIAEEPAADWSIAGSETANVQISQTTIVEGPLELPTRQLAVELASQLEREIRVFRNEALPPLVEKPVKLAHDAEPTASAFEPDWLRRELEAAYNERDCMYQVDPAGLEMFPPRLVRDDFADEFAPAEPTNRATSVVEVVYREPEYLPHVQGDWRADFAALEVLVGVIGNEVACHDASNEQSQRIVANDREKVSTVPVVPVGTFNSPVQP